MMRKRWTLEKPWFFSKMDCGPQAAAELTGQPVTLPHTWNAQDGQDGGNDYYRGACWYAARLPVVEWSEDEEIWLEFEGVAMTAEVYLNGQKLARHEGGYSTFRVNLTPALQKTENILAVRVDNGKNRTVYPQKADFTFYGGIYRPVHLLVVPAAHFALEDHGGPGLRITPYVAEDRQSARVMVEAEIRGDAKTVWFTVDGQKKEAAVLDGRAEAEFLLHPVHLWNGTEDPYLYTAAAELDSGDRIEEEFGCRTIAFDPEQGFILNGKQLRLCGAARHQDRQGIGNALTPAEHEEDMSLLREMGANTVRLAHYQHSQYFYRLGDRYGMIVWAEIPYITEHMPEARGNALSQMTELVAQNYNHPSIVCWCLSNEITASSKIDEDLYDTHRQLNDLVHRMDPTRSTVMAHAFMLDPAEPFAHLADLCSYNLYYGWYLGELEDNDAFFDQFHHDYPDQVIGLSEYGADANPAYQNDRPEKGDWSEPYQAIYHEHLLKMWSKRPYIWAMHCWNMFDFAADGREEGGKPGQNQKGLVTFDRKIKKDAFYLYKAYLSKTPFVHLCGRRYVDRPGQTTEIKVYTNQPQVTLYQDGRLFGCQSGDKVFVFQVELTGEHCIRAEAGGQSDEIQVRRVEQENLSYRCGSTGVVNWFDKPEEMMREGYYSIFDSMGEIKQTPEGAALVADLMRKVRSAYGEVAQNVTLPPAAQKMLDQSPFYKTLKQAGKAVTPSMIKELNAALNQISKKMDGDDE